MENNGTALDTNLRDGIRITFPSEELVHTILAAYLSKVFSFFVVPIGIRKQNVSATRTDYLDRPHNHYTQ